MCHSENRHDDKQNKNRWGSYTGHQKIHTVMDIGNRWGLVNCGHYSENAYGDKQNKNRWRMQDLVLGNGYSDKEMDR